MGLEPGGGGWAVVAAGGPPLSSWCSVPAPAACCRITRRRRRPPPTPTKLTGVAQGGAQGRRRRLPAAAGDGAPDARGQRRRGLLCGGAGQEGRAVRCGHLRRGGEAGEESPRGTGRQWPWAAPVVAGAGIDACPPMRPADVHPPTHACLLRSSHLCRPACRAARTRRLCWWATRGRRSPWSGLSAASRCCSPLWTTARSRPPATGGCVFCWLPGRGAAGLDLLLPPSNAASPASSLHSLAPSLALLLLQRPRRPVPSQTRDRACAPAAGEAHSGLHLAAVHPRGARPAGCLPLCGHAAAGR